MKIKSLRLALKVLDVCLIRHERNVCYYGNDEAYQEAKEAEEDIENFIRKSTKEGVQIMEVSMMDKKVVKDKPIEGKAYYIEDRITDLESAIKKFEYEIKEIKKEKGI